MSKVKDKEKNFKAAREKQLVMYKRSPKGFSLNFSAEADFSAYQPCFLSIMVWNSKSIIRRKLEKPQAHGDETTCY